MIQFPTGNSQCHKMTTAQTELYGVNRNQTQDIILIGYMDLWIACITWDPN